MKLSGSLQPRHPRQSAQDSSQGLCENKVGYPNVPHPTLNKKVDLENQFHQAVATKQSKCCAYLEEVALTCPCPQSNQLILL